MSRSELNDVQQIINDEVKGTMEALQEIQGSPIGTVPRSVREQRKLYRDTMALPPHLAAAVIGTAFERAGHQDGEARPCEACRAFGDLRGV